MTVAKYTQNYFLILFSFIPVSIILGSSISLFNILLIDISFLILIISNKDYSFFKNKSLKYLLYLYLYLLFNSVFSLDFQTGLHRNLGFIRIIILFAAINYFFRDENFLKKVFFVWAMIISFISIDVLIEFFSGKNLLGYGENYGRRIVSFFKDEPIVGGYINSFYLLIIGFLFYRYKKKYSYQIIIFSIFLLSIIFLTGERSNSIKAIIGLFLFLNIALDIQLKKKILITISSFVVLLTIILNSEFLKLRFVDQMKSMIYSNNYYYTIYNSGFEVFKKYPITGAGNKNYRIETCNNLNELKEVYVCVTHPHQIYIEFISEHGILGTIILLYIFYKLIFSKIKTILRDKNLIQIGAMIYLLEVFLPVLPGGAFFSDFVMTIFAINLSILYAVSSKTNIFIRSK